MKTAKYRHSAVTVGNYIYILGGRTETEGTTASCQKYSISQDEYIDTSPMNKARGKGFTSRSINF